MKSPRIYTYKVTFKGAPFWYWGVHKEMRYGESYFGSPKTRKWFWEFYEPEIQILEFFPYTDEGWNEACKVEKRLIRPDLNDPYCLNENAGGYFSMEVLRKAAKKGAKKGAAAVHAKKDGMGRSLHSLKLHTERDGDGKSLHGKKCAAALNAEKDKDGKSVNAKKGAAALNAKLTKEEKSEIAKKAGAASKLACQKKVELTRILDKVTFVFDSGSDACRSLDLNPGHLSEVCNGKQKTHKGYTARYLPRGL